MQRDTSLEPRILHLSLLEDRGVVFGAFPKCKELLVRCATLACLTLERVGTREAEMREHAKQEVLARSHWASIRHAWYSDRLAFQPKLSERFWCPLRGLCHARSLVGGVIRISRIVELLEHYERSKAELEKRIVELKTTAGLV